MVAAAARAAVVLAATNPTCMRFCPRAELFFPEMDSLCNLNYTVAVLHQMLRSIFMYTNQIGI
jgi:hypothetical protein